MVGNSNVILQINYKSNLIASNEMKAYLTLKSKTFNYIWNIKGRYAVCHVQFQKSVTKSPIKIEIKINSKQKIVQFVMEKIRINMTSLRVSNLNLKFATSHGFSAKRFVTSL